MVADNGLTTLQGGDVWDLMTVGHVTVHYSVVKGEVGLFLVNEFLGDIVDPVMFFDLGTKIEEEPVGINLVNLTSKRGLQPGKIVCSNKLLSGLILN